MKIEGMTYAWLMPALTLALGLATPGAAQAHPPAQPSDIVNENVVVTHLGAARVALQEGRHADALGHLSEGPALANYRAFLRGHALWGLERPVESEAALARVRPIKSACKRDGQPLWSAAIETRAEIARATQPQKAVQLLAQLPPTPQRLVMRAHLARRARDSSARREAERQLLIVFPASGAAKKLEKRLGSKRVDKVLGADGWMERLTNALAAHDNARVFKEASRRLEGISKKDPTRCALIYVAGKAARKLRKYGAAQRLLSRGRKRCAKDPLAPRFALLETRVRGIRGQVSGTRVSAEWLLAHYPEHSYTDDAMLIHAKTLERSGRPAAASKIYLRLQKELAHGDETPGAVWQLAYLAIRSKDPKSAQKHLEWILSKKLRRPIDRARAQYWLARTLEESDPARSEVLYRQVVRHPSFYAWLALARLDEKDPKFAQALKAELLAAVKGAASSTASFAPLSEVAAFARGRLYHRLGADEQAAVEFDRVACEDLDDRQSIALARAYSQLGEHPAAQRILRKRRASLLGELTPASASRWLLAYSRPYWDDIQAAAAAEKLEALLLIALVREESTFDPNIVSWAGATGLAQLMPGTAIGAHAEVFRGRRLRMNRLTDPKLNLRLGAHVLKDGLVDFKRVPALALSAYNGGNRLTRRFLPDRPTEFAHWVEQVSVKETRRYIKRVTESWGIYRLLYDAERPFIELPKTIAKK